VTRAAFVLAFALAAHVGADPMPRVVYPPEPEPKLMRVITALLDAAREFRLDPVLVFSVAWAESSLRPGVQSRRDCKVIARGLMQISVQWQDDLVTHYLGWCPSNFDWRDPVHSAKLGCAYLAALVKRFGVWGGVAAYNCGPGRYLELAHGRALPAETVEYLRRVLG